MKPGFQPGLKNQVVDPETNVIFNCSTTGHPAPHVYWEDSKHRRVNDDAILVITNVRKSETYTCFAKNELGNASISVNLTLSGLPFPPSNVIVKSKTGHTLTVSWQDGEAGVKIDYHNINYRKRGDPNWKTVYNIVGNSRERVLDELDPYSFYEVQVFAVNNVGTSKGSQIVVIRTEETGEFILSGFCIVLCRDLLLFLLSANFYRSSQRFTPPPKNVSLSKAPQ